MSANKKILLAVKIIIVALSLGFLTYKINTQFHSINYKEAYCHIKWPYFWMLLLVCLMTFLNWFTETLKWRYLIQKLQNISIIESLVAVLSGITVSIITPNRVGEFGGRILALEPKNRVAGTFATLLGGYSQLLITLIIGTIALPIYLQKFPNQIPFKINHSLLFVICIVVIFVCLFMYFKIKFFAKLAERLIKQTKNKRFVRFLRDYHRFELINILGFSFLRYIIFTSQFYLILYFFGVQIPYYEAILGISLIYFILAIIPIISLFEFSIRSSVAVLVLGVFSSSTIGIISAALMLWILNIAIPALIGTITLLRLKI